MTARGVSRLRQPRLLLALGVLALLVLVSIVRSLGGGSAFASVGATTPIVAGRGDKGEHASVSHLGADDGQPPAAVQPRAAETPSPPRAKQPISETAAAVPHADVEDAPTRATDELKVGGPKPARRLNAPKRTLKPADTQIRTITVQTGGTPGWCRMLRSAALSEVDVHSIAWGQKYAHRKRPEWILNWIERNQRGGGGGDGKTPSPSTEESGKDDGSDTSFDDPPPGPNSARLPSAGSANSSSSSSSVSRPLDDWDVIMFLDGGDSAFTGATPKEMLTRFMGLTVGDVDVSLSDAMRYPKEVTQQKLLDVQDRMGQARYRTRNRPVPLLFNAEANCYHQQLFSGNWASMKSRCITSYLKHNPWAQGKYRYLNAGGWIGYTWAVKRFFAEAKKILDAKPSLWCDQSVIGGLYLSGEYSNLVHIDTANALYLPTYHLRQTDFCMADLNDAGFNGGIDFDQVVNDDPSRALRMCHSLMTPAVLHFNGKSEAKRVDQLLSRSSWYLRSRKGAGKANAEKRLATNLVALDKNDGSTLVRKPLREACPGYDVLP